MAEHYQHMFSIFPPQILTSATKLDLKLVSTVESVITPSGRSPVTVRARDTKGTDVKAVSLLKLISNPHHYAYFPQFECLWKRFTLR